MTTLRQDLHIYKTAIRVKPNVYVWWPEDLYNHFIAENGNIRDVRCFEPEYLEKLAKIQFIERRGDFSGFVLYDENTGEIEDANLALDLDDGEFDETIDWL